ncbi:MAG: c-type cytochrome [Gammaproteobacteria bacterium]|nr:c-type cytochrome [Gammaproteobacteria bacterium]
MKKILLTAASAAILLVSHTAAADGQATYNSICKSCHATGAAGAPKIGDKAAWAPRIAKGINALFQSSIKGVPGTSMMPKGMCAACSEDDLKATVEYMVSQSK